MCDGLLTVNEKRSGHELGTTQDEMRKFWEDHITRTRLYLVSAAADLPDKDEPRSACSRTKLTLGRPLSGLMGTLRVQNSPSFCAITF